MSPTFSWKHTPPLVFKYIVKTIYRFYYFGFVIIKEFYQCHVWDF